MCRKISFIRIFLVPWFATFFFLTVQVKMHCNFQRSFIFPAGKFFFGLQEKAWKIGLEENKQNIEFMHTKYSLRKKLSGYEFTKQNKTKNKTKQNKTFPSV